MEEIEEETEEEKSEKNKKYEEDLDREFTTDKVIDALFALKSDTAAGNDSILSKVLTVILETHIKRENWKNVEILKFLQSLLQNLWEKEVSEEFKEIIIRPFLKKCIQRPKKTK